MELWNRERALLLPPATYVGTERRPWAFSTDFSQCCIIVKVCPVLSDVETPENVHSLARAVQKVAADMVPLLIGVDLQPEGCERSFLPKTVFFHFDAHTSESDSEQELSLPSGFQCQE